MGKFYNGLSEFRKAAVKWQFEKDHIGENVAMEMRQPVLAAIYDQYMESFSQGELLKKTVEDYKKFLGVEHEILPAKSGWDR